MVFLVKVLDVSEGLDREILFILCCFVLAADLLQAIISRQHQLGNLSLPIPRDGPFSIIQYADDTILVLPAEEKQLTHLKEILHLYASSTGLKINFHKSNLVPINIEADRAKELADIFGCAVASMPFTYLGLPLGTTHPSVTDFLPLVDRIERRMSSTTALLSYGKKLTIINSVLSSLATYTMCSLQLPIKVVNHIDKTRRRCLWSKRSANGESNNALVAWDKLCRPKKHVGLGVINLRVQN